ncbi:sulfur carrier protein ThiS [Verrucomicrobiota bacterium]
MNLLVNGEPHKHGGNGSIVALLEECGANAGRVALMVNGAVVARGSWDEVTLQEDDRIELLVFAAGG